MKILYLTTSTTDEDFNYLNNIQNKSLNPSNQNFHHRLITSISLTHEVDVISYRPLRKEAGVSSLPYLTKKVKNITYHYLPVLKSRLWRSQNFKKTGRKYIRQLLRGQKNQYLIFVDGLNQTLTSLAHKFNVKTVGIITDNPYFLSNLKDRYAKKILKKMQGFSGYLALSESLNSMVNKNKDKPYLIVEGISEEKMVFSKYNRPYFFFGGALHERYGLNNLLTAFMSVNEDIDLLISGHGPREYLHQQMLIDPRIKDLGLLSKDEVCAYASGALANINPRPLDNRMDNYSIPSKFFEYLTSGTVTISTEHPLLFTKFRKTVLWAGRGDSRELKIAFDNYFLLSNYEKDLLGKSSRQKALEQYGFYSVNKRIDYLISLLK